jgi:hypothetical protein
MRWAVTQNVVDFTMKSEPIRARMIDANIIAAGGVRLVAVDPVQSLCRRLIADGYDPSLAMKVWRGSNPIRLIHAIADPNNHTDLKTRGSNAF